MLQHTQSEELQPQEMSEILRRAQVLESAAPQHTPQHAPQSSVDSFLQAAEELGLSRQALVQALRERSGQALEGVEPGDAVFAKSADGAFYAATVLETKSHSAVVRFASAGDHEVALPDLRRFSILPGQKLEAKQGFWGWLPAEVEKYDPQKQKVTVSDGFNSKAYPLTEIRLPVEKTRRELAVRALLFRVGLISAGIGGVLGALLMRFFS
jgi:hypothetical protein